MLLFIRKETIPHEYRSPIIPKDIPILIENNYTVLVESSSNRCFSDSDFEKQGAIIVTNEWFYYNATILGLKELEHPEYLNHHVHIYFAHCYKQQLHATKLLKQFQQSSSILYDLEYFTYSNNQRFLAFGFYAGIAGCILALKQFHYKHLGPLSYIKNLNQTIFDLLNCNMNPSVAVVGNHGRCGQGVCHILNLLHLKYHGYSSESKKTNLSKYDIVFNCIYLKNYIQPWFTYSTKFKKPIVICDISCDPYHEYNPIKLYDEPTTWEHPVYQYNDLVSIIAIDNLPSLVPIESSIYFSNKMVELLLLKKNDTQHIWKRNLNIYDSTVKSLE
jgi:saccharopine dehydrogenase (NAD+, L-lysine-forming)